MQGPQAPRALRQHTAFIRLVEWRDRKSIVTLTRTTNPSISLALRALHVRGPGEMQGLPQAPKGPLVKLLEGFHSPCTACIRLVEWRDRKSIVTVDHNQPINFSSPACPACQRAGSEMQGLPQAPKRVLHSPCTACIRLVEWRDRKSIVTLTRTTNPSISLALRAPHVRGPGVRDARAAPGTQGPLVKLLEGFHSPWHAFVWSVARS
jgi:hypothetical protein